MLLYKARFGVPKLRLVVSEAELYVRDKWVRVGPAPHMVLCNLPSTCLRVTVCFI